MVIDDKLIPLFEKINFADRYIDLCRRFNDFDNHLSQFDLSLVENLYKEAGLFPKFFKREKFFSVEESIGNFTLQFKTVPTGGFVQFLFSIKEKEEKLKIGMGMWEVITRSLKGEVVRKPIFTTEDELKAILNTAVELYKEFKYELSQLELST